MSGKGKIIVITSSNFSGEVTSSKSVSFISLGEEQMLKWI